MARAPTRKLDIFKKQNELEKLLKDLKRLNGQALEVLKEGMSCEDLKVRVQCADKILSYTTSISKEIDTQQLNRLIASIRFDAANNNLTAVEDSSGPVLAFDEIHPDFADKDDVTTINLTDIKSIG